MGKTRCSAVAQVGATCRRFAPEAVAQNGWFSREMPERWWSSLVHFCIDEAWERFSVTFCPEKARF